LIAHELAHVIQQRAGAAAIQRQPAKVSPQPPRPDSSPGLGPARTQELESLIKAGDFQGAIDTLVGYKYMDYEIDLNLLADKSMAYAADLGSDDATVSMPSWDYASTPQKSQPAQVKIGPTAFSSLPYLYSVIMHEYQHVLWQQTLAHQQESHLLRSQGFQTPDEVVASAWELFHASETGLDRLPDKVAHVWKILNQMFWALDAQSQKEQRPLALRALQKAKDLTKTSKVPLVPFSSHHE
jgi:hypothetical protein